MQLSVIICARNEEKLLYNALSSIEKQDFPDNLYELIIVDDASTDNTISIAKKFCEAKRNFRLISISNVDRMQSMLSGKQNCLDTAIAMAQGKYIVQLDADCTALPSFLKTYNEYFENGNDFVFGITEIGEDDTLFKQIQKNDLHYLMNVSYFAASFGLPLSCMGNNIGYSRSAYYSIGGYQRLGQSEIEDLQLLTAFKKGNKKIAVIRNSEILVKTKAERGIIQFVKQRIRWASGFTVASAELRLIVLFRLLLTAVLWIGLVQIVQSKVEGLFVATPVLLLDLSVFLHGGHLSNKRLDGFLVWLIYFYLQPILVLFGFFLPLKDRWK